MDATKITSPSRRIRFIGGGADPAEHIAELIGRGLENLTPEELAELDTTIQTRAEELAEASTEEELAELQGLAEHAEAVRAETQRRDEVAAQIETDRSAALERIRPVADADGDAGDGGDGGDGDAGGDGGDGGDAGTADGGTGDGGTDAGTGDGNADDDAGDGTAQPTAVAASGRRPAPGAASGSRPRAAAPRNSAPASQPATITASGDIPNFAVGQSLSFEELGVAFAEKAHAVKNSRFKGKALVASVRWEYPEDRQLGGDASRNLELIEAAMSEARNVSMEALVAAGGICAPTEVRYDLENVSTTRRPIRDSLVKFAAKRGGVRFVRPPILTDLTGAVALWSHANDADPNNVGDTDVPVDERLAAKPCLRIECGNEVEVIVDAITRCLEVGNFARRTFPEQWAAFWGLAEAWQARFAEDRLFARMAANSTAITDQEQLGAARDILEAVGRYAAQYRSRHRMADDAVLRYMAPDWVKDMIVADITRSASDGVSNFEVGRERVDTFFRTRDIAVTWTPDGDGQYFGAQAEGAGLPWPTSYDALLFHEGAHIFLDGGELDLGTEIRDRADIAVNDVAAFLENFENTAFTGVESLVITHDVCASGVAQAAAAVDVCTVGGGS